MREAADSGCRAEVLCYRLKGKGSCQIRTDSGPAHPYLRQTSDGVYVRTTVLLYVSIILISKKAVYQRRASRACVFHVHSHPSARPTRTCSFLLLLVLAHFLSLQDAPLSRRSHLHVGRRFRVGG